MANIRDVAKMAQVSSSTVSIYLNNRKPLKEETVKKIENAIKKLNYVVQSSGRDLRLKTGNDIGIIFPNISEPYLEKVINSVKGYLSQNGKNFIFELSDDDPKLESKAIYNFIGKKIAGIIIYSCQPNNKEIFRLLDASKIPYVLIDRKCDEMYSNFVSTDNNTLFYNLSTQLINAGHKHIALVCGPQEYNENKSAYLGFLKTCEEKNCCINPKNIIFTSVQRENGFRAGMQLLDKENDIPTAILTTSYRLAEGIRYAFFINHIDARKDVTIISTGDSIDDVFYYNPSIFKTWRYAYFIGETAGRILLDNIKSPCIFEKQEVIFQDSFSKHIIQPVSIKKPKIKSVKSEINVLLLDDDISIHGLQQLFVNFYEKENIVVNFQKVLPEKAFDTIVNNINTFIPPIDVFMFDVPWLSYLAQKDYLLCIDDFLDQYNINEKQFVPGALNGFGKYNSHYYAMPYMACSQILFYRRDLFENKELNRLYESKYMVPLEVPTTWLHYNNVAQFFTKKYNPKSPVKYGHAMSISYAEQFICELMPRIWSYGDDFCNEKGEIHINTPKIQKAVLSMLKCVETSEPSLFKNRPIDTVESFINGDTAMLCTFYNYATSIVDRFKSKVYGNFGYGSIPGNCSVLAGWSLGISSKSKNPCDAFKFINWACGKEIAIAHTILGGQSPQTTVYSNYDIISLYPWLSKAFTQFEKCKERKTPLNALGQALNEKQAEEIIFANLVHLMKSAFKNSNITKEDVNKALLKTQTALIHNLK